jgi:hypothetical protein
MTRRGLFGAAAGVLLSCGLVPALSGCGGADTTTGPVEDVKAIAPVNPAPGTVPIDEEYKSMQKGKKGS